MKKHTVSWDDFQSLVSKICRDISVSDWRPDYVVGITRGGLLPAVMISHYFDIPCHTLGVRLRDGKEGADTESNLWMAEEAFGHPIYDPMCSGSGRKNILVVDDINDSGATINWIMKDWPSGCFPDDPSWEEVWNDNVRFAVLFDNLDSRCNIDMDYVGTEVNKAENDIWIDFPFEDWWTK
jgi:xanthine phosphoribosyltransferase